MIRSGLQLLYMYITDEIYQSLFLSACENMA